MLKVALLAAAFLVVAPAAHAANSAPGSAAALAASAPCHPVQATDVDCAMRVMDTNGDGTISPAELASFNAPTPPATDWPLRPPHSTGLDFKDAATEPAPAFPAAAAMDGDASHRLIPALLALGALVILLRKRPA